MLTIGLCFPFYIATQAATLTDSNHIAGGCLLSLPIFHLRIDEKSASNLIVVVSKVACRRSIAEPTMLRDNLCELSLAICLDNFSWLEFRKGYQFIVSVAVADIGCQFEVDSK